MLFDTTDKCTCMLYLIQHISAHVCYIWYNRLVHMYAISDTTD